MLHSNPRSDGCPPRGSRTLPTSPWRHREARWCGPRLQRSGIDQADTLSQWLNAFVKNMPAWLISLLFHVLLLTVLGLLTQPPEKGPYIALSMRVSHTVRDGGYARLAGLTRCIRV